MRKLVKTDKSIATVDADEQVPGLTPNPATNLLLADIGMRMGSYVLRAAMEKTFLRGRYGKATAREIVNNQSLGQKLTSVAIAKVGTKSVPGAALVGVGLVGKLLFDRSKSRQAARKAGDQQLLNRADEE